MIYVIKEVWKMSGGKKALIAILVISVVALLGLTLFTLVFKKMLPKRRLPPEAKLRLQRATTIPPQKNRVPGQPLHPLPPKKSLQRTEQKNMYTRTIRSLLPSIMILRLF